MTQNKTKKLFEVGGYSVLWSPTFFPTFVLLWMTLNLVMMLFSDATYGQITVFGLGAVLIHYFAELLHNVGHAIAARSTGYPMSGIRLWYAFIGSLYPKDEPELSSRIHVTRALGGPILSLILALAMWGVLQVIPYANEIWQWWLRFFFWDNLLILGLGAFLPLGFTDGSTILREWRNWKN